MKINVATARTGDRTLSMDMTKKETLSMIIALVIALLGSLLSGGAIGVDISFPNCEVE